VATRFELEDRINYMPPRERRRLTNPFGDLVQRNGRMLRRYSPAERAARRRRGHLKDQVFDVWTAFQLGDDVGVAWFLSDYMQLGTTEDRSLEDLRKALYYVVGTSWAERPAREVLENPPPWRDPTTANPKGYLYKAIREEAERHKRSREVDDKPWGLKGQRAQRRGAVLPSQCEFNPEVHGQGDEGRDDPSTDIGLSRPELLEELTEFQRQELGRSLAKQAEGVLPERQYQVFRLRAEGRSYKEIANQLEITVGAAKSNMFHARQNAVLQKIGGQWV